MTIAVGMLIPETRDFVIAADTQETYLHAKVEGQKVMTASVVSLTQEPLGCVVFTGAGSAGYLDALWQYVQTAFLDSDDLIGPLLRSEFEKAIIRFYRRHVIPFGETWAGNEQLPVSTLIAYQRGATGHGLFSNTMTAVKETACTAVGTGEVVALGHLHRLREPNMSTESALRLAAYAVFHAKEHDPYCGKRTHLVLLSGNRQQTVEPAVIESWEDTFREMGLSDAVSTAICLGIRNPSDGVIQQLVTEMSQRQGTFQPSGVTQFSGPPTE